MEIRAYAGPEKGAAPVPFSYRAELGEHDVLVKLTHRSITRGDLQMIDDDWGDARFPLVPCHEMVGIVDRTGSRVTDLKTGDRVGIGCRRGGGWPSAGSGGPACGRAILSALVTSWVPASNAASVSAVRSSSVRARPSS